MNKILSILFFSISAFTYSQSNIKGKIIDADTKSELPYANIGIQGTNIGTVSDKNGNFNLNLNKKLRSSDTLQFSFLGYKKKLIQISSLRNKENVVKMIPQSDKLTEVVIPSKKPKEKTIGRNHIGTGTLWFNFYTAGEVQNDKLGTEAGMKFNLNGDYRLKSLNFYVGSNQYNSVKFRLNVYRLDNNEPTELLNREDIIFDVGDIQSDWFKVDLDTYDIYLEEELGSFAVTIQWLESKKKTPDSKFFAIPLGINPLDTKYFREKGMSNWNSSNHNLSFYLEVDRY
ncbi:carboxypeptidase-like regulatory domain-containing protein [Salegentibacter maritimus]|uniref:carboxypeptidase-like regulatory domain-containing protein n=1 Tax=Salegentibacter maritimus TaxID=2794347 RepID=UPI0018E45511|nr:carboxypeptidase-like regulatory domain-containing protein [Salegentibacter maritimus]MBI6117894.1 carboxypeptidase-like regulatory domain-containing protein [Salegentibacter maritimus]